MRGSIFALQLLGLLQLAKSQTSCTSDVAVPIDNSVASGSGSSSGSGSGPDAAAIASYQVAGASAIVDLTGSNLDGGSGGPADLIGLRLRRLLRKRADLECTSSESCYSIQGSPFCVNDQTNDFHLNDGTTGNLQTGDYTLSDGQSGNFNTGPYPTLGASASTTSDASAAIATGTSDGSTITGKPESTDTSATAATSTSASTRDRLTASAGSTPAAETGSSSSTRTPQTSSTTSGAVSPTASAQAFQGAAAPPAQYFNSHLAILAAMGLGAML